MNTFEIFWHEWVAMFPYLSRYYPLFQQGVRALSMNEDGFSANVASKRLVRLNVRWRREMLSSCLCYDRLAVFTSQSSAGAWDAGPRRDAVVLGLSLSGRAQPRGSATRGKVTLLKESGLIRCFFIFELFTIALNVHFSSPRVCSVCPAFGCPHMGHFESLWPNPENKLLHE